MGGNPKLRGAGKGHGAPVVSIEGQIVNRQCWIEVIFSNPLGANPDLGYSVEALIDTGATGSCVSEEFANRIGLKSAGVGWAQGIGGAQKCGEAPGALGFRTVDGKIISRTVRFQIHPMSVPILLGMNELAGGVLVVDGPSQTWRWKIPPSMVNSTKPQP